MEIVCCTTCENPILPGSSVVGSLGEPYCSQACRIGIFTQYDPVPVPQDGIPISPV